MYILPYLLQISTKNLIINNLVNKFKEKITNIINKFIFSNIKNIYVKLTFSLQELVNELSTDFLKEFIEAVDLEFKNSEKRKKQFYINKSNVKRTIYTIFVDVTFYRTLYQDKYTHEYYNYIDDVLVLESYKNYDHIVRGILIQDSVWSNPSHTAGFSFLNALHLKQYLKQSLSIPKQTIYLFKRQAKIGKVKYDEIKHGKTLYVMVDEKWVRKQNKTEPNKKKWIMVKCFVTFTGIKRKGKRSRLLGKHTFITSSDKPWQEFMKVIPDIYNFEVIENINLLSDAGSWILSGASELKLYSNNKVTINTCEFHVKQKINRSTTDKELRQKIADIIYEKNDKKSFIAEMDKLIDSKTKEARKQKN